MNCPGPWTRADSVLILLTVPVDPDLDLGLVPRADNSLFAITMDRPVLLHAKLRFMHVACASAQLTAILYWGVHCVK